MANSNSQRQHVSSNSEDESRNTKSFANDGLEALCSNLSSCYDLSEEDFIRIFPAKYRESPFTSTLYENIQDQLNRKRKRIQQNLYQIENELNSNRNGMVAVTSNDAIQVLQQVEKNILEEISSIEENIENSKQKLLDFERYVDKLKHTDGLCSDALSIDRIEDLIKMCTRTQK